MSREITWNCKSISLKMYKKNSFKWKIFYILGGQTVPTSKDEPAKFPTVYFRYSSRYLPTFKAHIYKLWR